MKRQAQASPSVAEGLHLEYPSRMVGAIPISPGEYVPTADQRVILHGVSWALYEHLLEERGEAPVPRMAYSKGVLELMSPSKGHESTKSFIGCLVEVWALERGVLLSPYGNWTLKRARRKKGLEPDECYLIGDQDRRVPDLAIEVIWTSGGIDKLEIYQALGVREVWFWKNAQIEVHVLGEDGYEQRPVSSVLPDLDLDLMVRFLDRPTAIEAMRDFRQALRDRGQIG